MPVNRFSSSTKPFGLPRRISTTTRTNTDRRCRASICAFPEAEAATAVERRRPASLYEVLQVKRTASLTEIKAAYRSLAKMYHPDAMLEAESDGQDFIQIHNAYATLSDPSARALYDLSLDSAQCLRRPFGFSADNRTGFYTTRRWETDQCW